MDARDSARNYEVIVTCRKRSNGLMKWWKDRVLFAMMALLFPSPRSIAQSSV